jgi:hypothetical protein
MKLLTFILFCLLSYQIMAQPKFDLNDPRNPDCPCHKLQKQAEQEYSGMNNESRHSLKKNRKNPKAEYALIVKFRMRYYISKVRKCRVQNDLCYKW